MLQTLRAWLHRQFTPAPPPLCTPEQHATLCQYLRDGRVGIDEAATAIDTITHGRESSFTFLTEEQAQTLIECWCHRAPIYHDAVPR